MAHRRRLVGLTVVALLILTFCSPVHSGSNATEPCSINVKNDLGSKGPLPVNLRENRIVSPDGTGNIRLVTGDILELYCSQHFEGGDTTETLLTVECVRHNKFLVNRNGSQYEIEIKNLKCSNSIRSTINTVSELDNGLTHLQIGFKVTSSNFVVLIDIHMNQTLLQPLLSQHRVGPGIRNAYTPETSRPNFRSDSIFPTEELPTLYSKQNFTICESILNIKHTSPDCTKYFEKAREKMLVRGHLAPMGDFEYRAGQTASFSLTNAVPQWQSINNGHWKKLENGIRGLAVKSELDIFTGVLGNMQMENNSNIKTNISLLSNGKYPVPEVVYKIIVSRQNKRAVVVLGNNDPLADVATIDAQRNRLCSNDKTSLIKWVDLKFGVISGKNKARAELAPAERVRKGYLFACDLAQFLRNTDIKGLPSFVTNTEYNLLINEG